MQPANKRLKSLKPDVVLNFPLLRLWLRPAVATVSCLLLLTLTVIRSPDRVIIASTAGTHLWGRAGLTVAPEPARVNKSSNKAAALKGLQMAQCVCYCLLPRTDLGVLWPSSQSNWLGWIYKYTFCLFTGKMGFSHQQWQQLWNIQHTKGKDHFDLWSPWIHLLSGCFILCQTKALRVLSCSIEE